MAKIDLNRCVKAMDLLDVKGVCNSAVRHSALEDAIKAIQEDGVNALMGRYFGVKNYAGFGDQRCDCQPGYGPTHGHIVFRIERRLRDGVLNENHIYLLECVRDFGGNKENLCDLIGAYLASKAKAEETLALIESAEVHPHVEDMAHA